MDNSNKTKTAPVNSEQRPHIVLVDDDPIFAKLLKRVAENERLHLTVISSPEEAYRTLPSLDFDVGLFDYDLGRVTGIQLCNYLQHEGRGIPVMLVSHWGEIAAQRWPKLVKKSLSKNSGPYSILAVARKVYRTNLRKEG